MQTHDILTAPDMLEDQMALVRARLHRDSAACQQAKQGWTNWKTHVQAHPWLAAGLAAALGYVLVPGRRRQPIAVQPATTNSLPAARSEPSLIGRLATELGRRAAQQAIAGGTAWAMAQWSARHAARQDSPSTNGHYVPARSESAEFGP